MSASDAQCQLAAAVNPRGTACGGDELQPDQLVLTFKSRGYNYWTSTDVAVHKHRSLRAIQRPLLAAMGGRVRRDQVAVIAPDGASYDEFGSQPFVAAQNGDDFETQLEALETPDLFAPTRAGAR